MYLKFRRKNGSLLAEKAQKEGSNLNLNHLGAVISKARHDRGLTQAELASKAGVSRNTISAIENDSYDELGVRRIERVCSCLRLGLSIGPFIPTPDDVIAASVDAAERADVLIEQARGYYRTAKQKESAGLAIGGVQAAQFLEHLQLQREL